MRAEAAGAVTHTQWNVVFKQMIKLKTLSDPGDDNPYRTLKRPIQAATASGTQAKVADDAPFKLSKSDFKNEQPTTLPKRTVHSDLHKEEKEPEHSYP